MADADAFMEEWEQDWERAPKAMVPAYAMDKPNAPIPLHKGNGVIRSKSGCEVVGECELVLRWMPNTSVVAQIQAPNVTPGMQGLRLMFDGPCTFTMDGLSRPAEVYIASASNSAYEAIINGEWPAAKLNELASLTFHLCNLPDVHGRFIGYETASHRGYRASRVVLESAGWTLTIDAVENLSDLRKTLPREGGFAITHVGRLTRSDASPFAPSDAEPVLSALDWFLGFCFGAWCGPLLEIGYDASSRVVLRDFGSPRCSRYRSSRGWCAHADGSTLEMLWPLFHARWSDPKWQPVLRRAIYWYINAESPELGVEGSLILAQAGLELLAWKYIVEERKLISANSFDLLPTADKLRLLLGSFEQTFMFYSEQKSLEALATKKKWSVAPWAMTEVRNRLVHPKNASDLDAQSKAIFESSELALHYLELSILFLLGYQGSYTNRVTCEWRGTTEPVPWGRNLPAKMPSIP